MNSTIAYRYEIDARPLAVLDGVVAHNEVERIAAEQHAASYTRAESDRADTRHIRTFTAEGDLVQFRKTPLFASMLSAVRTVFPGQELEEYRVYCNLILYGDAVFAHRDCHRTRADVTALYFANDEWRPEWGGETVFFNDSGESVYAIAPKPGRLVVFSGAIQHRVGVPSRVCNASRLTLVCKFKAPGDWQ